MEDSRQGESCDDASQASSTQGVFPISILMGFTSNAKGLLRAARGGTLIQDMPLQSPTPGHQFSQCPGRGGAEAMWFDAVRFS